MRYVISSLLQFTEILALKLEYAINGSWRLHRGNYIVFLSSLAHYQGSIFRIESILHGIITDWNYTRSTKSPLLSLKKTSFSTEGLLHSMTLFNCAHMFSSVSVLLFKTLKASLQAYHYPKKYTILMKKIYRIYSSSR